MISGPVPPRSISPKASATLRTYTPTRQDAAGASGRNGDRVRLRLARLHLPVAVERALHLDEPDDRPDQDQDAEGAPQPGPPVHGAHLAISLVHLPNLGRDHERSDESDDERDDEAENSADALAAVLLDLLLAFVDPDEVVDAERDDREEDHGQRAALLPQRAGVRHVRELLPWRQQDTPDCRTGQPPGQIGRSLELEEAGASLREPPRLPCRRSRNPAEPEGRERGAE